MNYILYSDKNLILNMYIFDICFTFFIRLYSYTSVDDETYKDTRKFMDNNYEAIFRRNN
jgi:hypothetical protein